MGVMLNATYRIWKDNKKQTVPAPIDPDTPKADWWYDHIAKNARAYRAMGFTAILLPPSCKTQGGQANDADGYGRVDDYDIGSKDQSYSVPTRFGSADQLRRCVAICHACGLDVYGDVVLHQYNGGRNGVYKYPSATGKENGRFPKTPSCFVGPPPRVGVDPVFSMEGNYAFGDMVAYINSTPRGYMAEGAVAAGDWLVRTVGFDGLRVDDTKGMNTAFVRRYVNSGAMADKFVFGECFEGNPETLNYWVHGSGMNGRASTVDFTIHWHLQKVCDSNGRASDLLSNGCGFFKRDPIRAVTYVESPDTDLSPGQQIISNKGLAYWFILTSEGYPSVYYRDMAADPFCYGLQPLIENLNWIHENLAFGATIPRHGDDRVACFERVGYPGLLSAGNWDTWNARRITVQTNFGPRVRLHDYTGHVDDIWTDSQGRATFTIPANSHSTGTSYVCFSRPGFGQQFEVRGRDTRQTFFGAEDLDIGPAQPSMTTLIARIWTNGQPVRFKSSDRSSRLIFGSTPVSATVDGSGWQQLYVINTASEPRPFTVEVIYRGTETL